ncbi:MAG: sugar transferase, partial [Verrucomicrobia bacterium]|nr:sugar transferase [Verrucomicrobiota bacterium]
MSNQIPKDLFNKSSFSKFIHAETELDTNCNLTSADYNHLRTTALPFWKRAMDIGLIVAGLPFILATAVPLAIFIKVVSRGPLFFKQERIGLGNRRFKLLKFRSMHCGADTSVHDQHLATLMKGEKPMQKMDGSDSRLIPLGKWIRASGLDELPQLLNVLVGDMSLVGPRPCTVFEFEQYEPWQKERFKAVPGLTGLWQVSGKNRTTFKQMIQMDIAYSRYKSLSMDLAIVVRTLPALIEQLIAARSSSKAAAAAAAKSAQVPKAPVAVNAV